jgi:RNA-directed DNA polymerase
MSLTTPLQIQALQWKLYEKAKRDPGYRFYSLADKIMRGDILAQAYDCAKANGGAPGVDGESFAMIERHGRTDWLNGLERALRTQTYQAKPVRRVMIPKPGGGERPLGIPSIRDRVVQTAAKLLLEPIFEADLEPNVFGYRPGRSALGAVDEVRYLLRSQYTDVVDADLSKYFDTIPHAELLRSVARRIADGYMLHLIKMWLTVPVEEREEGGRRRLHGGKSQKRGTPQGGVISPLLANVYRNRFLKHWRQQGFGAREK